MQPRPTEAELAILGVLWKHGPCTVGQVQQALNEVRKTGYTTALKLLQIMAEKGLVERDESGWRHVYRAKFGRRLTQRQLVRDLLDRAFEGSAHQLVMQALSARKTSPEELAAIRKLIDSLEEDKQ
jgi:BlaI family transcriptional regulator, penicillinase repressor